jgi:cobalt/nickel transport system permease protein
LALHIPDGLITSVPVIGATTVASAGGVAYSLRVARQRLDDRQIPLVGLTAAFVFAAQMLNFPVAAGTSGHLIGGVLAAVLLGPWMACLTLAVVLLVQAIGFADGGITVIGANISLMSLVAGVGGYWLFRGLTAVLPRTRGAFVGAAAVTAWLSIVAASALCTVYITYGGQFGPEAFPAVLGVMLGVHALIGVGEAVITALVVAAMLTARPDLVASAGRLRDVEPQVVPA